MPDVFVSLLYYEDLAVRSQTEPLPDIPRNGWHPLHERLSHREQTLDEDLTDLGISPHPRWAALTAITDN